MYRGIVVLIRLRKFWRTFRRTRAFVITALLTLLAVVCLAEFLFSNRLRFEMSGHTEKTLDLSDAVLKDGAVRKGNGIVIHQGTTVVFEHVQTEVGVIELTVQPIDSDELQKTEIRISTMEDASKNEYLIHTIGRVYSDEPGYIRFNSTGNVRTMRLQCTFGGDMLLTSVVLNRMPPFSFSFVRALLVYGLIIGLWSIRHFRAWKIMYDDQKASHRYATIVTVTLCAICLTLCCSPAKLNQFPFTEENLNAYERLFTSMHEGRVDLDLGFDPAKLEELENPYDITERNAHPEAHDDVYWDYAYYNGRFYCYFGIAPVLLVMYPVYILTGMVPNSFFISLVLVTVGTAALYAAIMQIVKYFRIKLPLLLLCLGFPALLFGALFPMNVISSTVTSNIYYVPVTCGLTMLSLMLYFAFAALNSKRRIQRRVWFALSGLCAVLVLASRPTMVLYAAALIPPFIAVLKERGRATSEKLIDACSFVAPLLIGVIPIMYYNYIRFDSPFEFGSIYQLTVCDISSYHVTFALFGDSIMHYFLQMPQLSGLFPYFYPSHLSLETYGQYFHSEAQSLGAIFFPMWWACALQGEVTKKQPVKKAFYLSLFLLVVLTVFLDTCLGGVCIRYIGDIMLPLVLLGFLVMLELCAKANQKCSDGTSFRIFLVCLTLCALTFLVGFSLLFTNTSGWIHAYPPVFRFFERIFS